MFCTLGGVKKEQCKGKQKKLFIEVLAQMRDWGEALRMGFLSCAGD